MTLAEQLHQQREEIERIAAKHGAGNVRLFGSVLRGEERPDSDIDLLVDVVGNTSSWFPGGLIVDLEKLLGRRVDVVIARSLHRRIKNRMLEEAVSL